jgi:hypothetical protein
VNDPERIVFQVINMDREEMFFGTTDMELTKTIEAIAKDAKGPAAGWQKGELVHWRPLTDLLPAEQAKSLASDLEKKTPPNKFKVIPNVAKSS